MHSADSHSAALSGPALFDLVMRGYHRQQVDEYLAALTARLDDLQARAHYEHYRADRAETELHATLGQLEQRTEELTRVGPLPAVDHDTTARGLGSQVTKLLQAAEEEAEALRASAAEHAAHLLEGANREAEDRRRQAQEALTAQAAEARRRADELAGRAHELGAQEHALTERAQQLTRRNEELDARERELDARFETVAADHERMVEAAERHAERLLLDAQSHIEKERSKADAALRERQLDADRELARTRQESIVRAVS